MADESADLTPLLILGGIAAAGFGLYKLTTTARTVTKSPTCTPNSIVFDESTGDTWVIDKDCVKHGIVSSTVFAECGYTLGLVQKASTPTSQAALAALPTGPILAAPPCPPVTGQASPLCGVGTGSPFAPGTIVNAVETDQTWLITAGSSGGCVRRGFPTTEGFAACGYVPQQVIPVDDFQIAAIPIGPNIFGPPDCGR